MDNIREFLLFAPVMLFSMVAHEYAHGYAALKQGDPTAFQLGRLTWNPVKHIDPFMTVLLPILTFFGSGGTFMFGGAKPVPVMPRNYRHYKRGDVIVSLAGIATNLVLAGLCVLLVFAFGVVGGVAPVTIESMSILQHMMLRGILFNLVLAVFNLLPLPPLDGSHVMKYLLPPAWSLRYQQLARYGIVILVLLLWTDRGQVFFQWWMKPVETLFRLAQTLVLPVMLRSNFSLGL